MRTISRRLALAHATRAVLLLAIAGPSGCCPPRDPGGMPDDGSLEPVAWLAGTWITEDGETEEVWTTPRAGTMLGVNRTVVAGELRHFEHLRIAREEGAIFYHASPARQAPARFRLVSHGERLVFEDPAHDYPQRIVYRRLADDRLEAGIEGNDDGRPKSSRWPMRRSPSP